MKIKILFVLCLFLFSACPNENDENDDVLNDEALILSMSFDFGAVTFDGNEGTIKAPENTDLENLMPTIEISEGAIIDPPSNTVTDFTEPVEYTVTSEDQSKVNYYTVSVLVPIINFIVLDCTKRTAENPTAEPAPDAEISVFKDVSGQKELIDELTTDANGEALLYGFWDRDYYILAEKNGAVHIIDGYVIIGIFKDQADIDMSPPQIQSSEIGDLKFMDVNGDGVVNEEDIVDHRKIWGVHDMIEEFEVYISEE